MFTPLNATMLNTGPVSLGLSVFAVGQAASDAWAFRTINFEPTLAISTATVVKYTPRKIAGYWGSTVGVAEHIAVQNKFAAGYGALVAISVTNMQIRNATRRLKGKSLGLAESYGDTLYRTVIGFGIWVAESKAAMEIRNATRWINSKPTAALSVQKSRVVRWVIPTTEVKGLADVFAWRLLSGYREGDIRRTIILKKVVESLYMQKRQIIIMHTQYAKSFEKQPSERFDYDLLGEAWLTVEDEFVKVIPKEVEPGINYEGYVISENGKRVKLWISGGQDGGSYKFSFILRTKYELEKEVDFFINIVERPHETTV